MAEVSSKANSPIGLHTHMLSGPVNLNPVSLNEFPATQLGPNASPHPQSLTSGSGQYVNVCGITIPYYHHIITAQRFSLRSSQPNSTKVSMYHAISTNGQKSSLNLTLELLDDLRHL